MRSDPIAVVVAIAALLGPGAAAAQTRASLPDIEDEVMCPICGTLLQLSDAPQAERERAFIRARIDQGQSKEQIKDALVDEYGENVLATPDSSGFDLTAWLVPALVIPVAGLLAWLGLRRRKGNTVRDIEPATDLAPGDARRLNEDLARWDRQA
jgi:cytochrome c-type biogenesis protein CcmH